jgi:hypothetical protein
MVSYRWIMHIRQLIRYAGPPGVETPGKSTQVGWKPTVGVLTRMVSLLQQAWVA